MRITDLLKPQSIDLNAVVADKPAAVLLTSRRQWIDWWT